MYKALYRTYRPQQLKDVAGQEHITKTLLNAIQNEKIAHAYLFSGPRGTGKTSVAKIIAKAVNCTNTSNGEPCNACSICVGINDGSITDVIEIDAASNNGVDEIREIRNRVKYLPSVGRFKVYIIDEVHMLSTSAFNALLKTLEEPPKHAMFILATTEPYKIPATIISRCQRFDFRGIPTTDIVNRLKEVTDKEKILIDDEAINLIALSSEGGMRDALSLLDQVISYANNKVTVNDVHVVNGSVSSEILLDLVLALFNRDCVSTLSLIDKTIAEGKEIPRVVDDLILFYRDLLLYKNANSGLEEKGLFSNDRFIDIAKKISNQRIYDALAILRDAQNDIKWTNLKKSYLELALIKLTDDTELKDAVVAEKLESIEKRLVKLETTGVKQENRNVTKIVADEKKDSDNCYNTLIEEVLKTSNEERKELLYRGWDSLRKINDQEKINIARTLSRSQIIAINDNKMIISYPDKASCNLMMKTASKNIVLSILNRKSKLIEDYVALTDNEWFEIEEEYNKQKKQGIENPSLSSMGLSFDTTEIVVQKEKNKSIEDLAVEFFGKDKIEIVEE